ncbi:cytochrome P450 [Legionella jordanis]|uniref:Cytochrome P450 n=1 Tax=Legionella jordanis TaxID=456 RepID=A0A0W0VB10_9GAMM|nr:cytochrome P450 [Legionella jordanis]KTD17284.1 Cytochrome P450 [Legionella jordanis]RMW99471.1 cytochrome P450 [Legionella jordanis]RMX15321.1 cytochrome P450 [Legionella jordanis]VEH12517.1 putative unspecific monooxygenase [Legionella jordanis]
MFNFFKGPDSAHLLQILQQTPSQIVRVNFGWLFGNVYFLKAKNDHDLTELINQLDNEPRGRAPMDMVDYVLGGTSLLASTESDAINYHQCFVHAMAQPRKYIALGLEHLKSGLDRLEENQPINLKVFLAQLVSALFFQGLFNLSSEQAIDHPFLGALASLSKGNQDSGADFANEIRLYLANLHYPTLFHLGLYASARKGQQEYQMQIQQFLASQQEAILTDLHHYGDQNYPIRNVLSLAIIHLIAKKLKLNSDREMLRTHLQTLDKSQLGLYLNEPMIRTLPGMLVASTGVASIVANALTALMSKPKLLSKVRSALPAELFSHSEDEIFQQINDDKQKGGLLHRLYLESCRFARVEESVAENQVASRSWRFTTKDLKVGDQMISANSMIVILRHWPFFNHALVGEQPGLFKPSRFKNTDGSLNQERAQITRGIFFQGKRQCPSHNLAEYLFKTIIAYLITHYELTSAPVHDGTVHLTPIQLNQVLFKK